MFGTLTHTIETYTSGLLQPSMIAWIYGGIRTGIFGCNNVDRHTKHISGMPSRVSRVYNGLWCDTITFTIYGIDGDDKTLEHTIRKFRPIRYNYEKGQF